MNGAELQPVIISITSTIAIYALVAFIVAKTSGWQRLAEKYPAMVMPTGEQLNLQAIKINKVRYNNAVTIIASSRGLYLAMFPLLRFGHNPLLLPWYQITAEQEGRWTKLTIQTTGRPVTVTLSQKTADKLKISHYAKLGTSLHSPV